MSRLKRHIGEGETVEIDGDEFQLKPLGSKYYGEFMKIAKGFSGAKSDDDMEGMFKNFTDETMEAINKVVIDTLKKSLPDETDEDIDMFAGKHMMKLLPAITKMNGLAGSGDKRKDMLNDKLAQMRAKKDEHSQSDKE